MDIHITNKTKKNLEVVSVIKKVRQLNSKHRVSSFFFVDLVEGGTNRSKFIVFCCCPESYYPHSYLFITSLCHRHNG